MNPAEFDAKVRNYVISKRRPSGFSIITKLEMSLLLRNGVQELAALLASLDKSSEELREASVFASRLSSTNPAEVNEAYAKLLTRYLIYDGFLVKDYADFHGQMVAVVGMMTKAAIMESFAGIFQKSLDNFDFALDIGLPLLKEATMVEMFAAVQILTGIKLV